MNVTVSRYSGSWASSQAWDTVSSIWMPWDPEETPNRGKALMVWRTVCCLTHGHHAESVAPILARNEAVFAQPDLGRFKRAQALREVRSQEGFLWTALYKLPKAVAADSPTLVDPAVYNP